MDGVDKNIIIIDEEIANEQRAKQIGTNYQPYWVKQYIKLYTN